MAGNIAVKLNLPVDKIIYVLLNFIPSTFNTFIKATHLHSLKHIFNNAFLNRSPFSSF